MTDLTDDVVRQWLADAKEEDSEFPSMFTDRIIALAEALLRERVGDAHNKLPDDNPDDDDPDDYVRMLMDRDME